MNPRAIIAYHGGCNDGSTAAFIAATALAGTHDVTLHPAGYRGPDQPEDLPDLTEVDRARGDVLVIVDFSYRSNRLVDLCDRFESVTWLDHHQSAIEAWEVNPFEPWNLRYRLQQDACGAMIAFSYFDFPTADGQDLEGVVTLVDARDRWLKSAGEWHLPGTEEVFCALGSLPRIEHDFGAWTAMLSRPVDEIIEIGRPVVEYRQGQVRASVASAYELTIDGHNVHVANVPYSLGSDVAEALNLAHPNEAFSGYWFSNGRELHFGLRSDQHNPNAADVAEIAEKFGGGGHRHASGFRLDALRFHVSAEHTVILP